MSEEPSPHLHLLSSENAGWKNLQLIYEKEPTGEMPATFLEHHFIVNGNCPFRSLIVPVFNLPASDSKLSRGFISVSTQNSDCLYL